MVTLESHAALRTTCVYTNKWKKNIFFLQTLVQKKTKEWLCTKVESLQTVISSKKKVSKGWCNFHLVMSTVSVNIHQCFTSILALALVYLLWNAQSVCCCVVLNWCYTLHFSFVFSLLLLLLCVCLTELSVFYVNVFDFILFW